MAHKVFEFQQTLAEQGFQLTSVFNGKDTCLAVELTDPDTLYRLGVAVGLIRGLELDGLPDLALGQSEEGKPIAYFPDMQPVVKHEGFFQAARASGYMPVWRDGCMVITLDRMADLVDLGKWLRDYETENDKCPTFGVERVQGSTVFDVYFPEVLHFS